MRARAALLLLVTAAAAPLRAQLFSPGKLASAHADLEGIRNCTQCHELRQRGTSNALCLKCHTTLATRIAAGTGLHSTYGDRNCASCHRDHLGLDHPLVALDTARFDHDTTRFSLGGSHLDLGCRKCHTPARIVAADVKAFEGEHGALDRTFLGLPVTCVGCHQADSDHGTQFGQRSCDACHTDDDWKRAERFDHARTRFQLTGLHLTLDCSACHRPTSRDPAHPKVKYTGIPSATCSSCHADPHRGLMTGACSGCHTTDGWLTGSIAGMGGKFDHARTHFPLSPAHARVDCKTCHQVNGPKPAGIRITWAEATGPSASFPRPVFASCTGCHVDRHDGIFATSPGGSGCTNCHGPDAWLPTTYDLTRHATSRFPLTGAHQAVPCNACHAADDTTRGMVFRLARLDCAGCHRKDDPHQGQFAGRICESCHETSSFAVTDFDHSRTRYPLDGAHRTVPCAGCHKTETAPDGKRFRRFTPLGTACRDCHGGT